LRLAGPCGWVDGFGCATGFAGVELFNHALEAGTIDVGVNLRGGDIAVAEHFLNAAEVGPAGEQVGCKGVAEHVGVNTAKARGGGAAADDLPDERAGEWFAAD